ncbi:hypothetical protein DL240_04860 [Lujinxingia litoralis]|uniref:PDZ domain-containing protein n=1 Tax=Lujinxingia litoralis TaxID=2211119 RepID=A0A328C6D3_9DELT|nr:redoxin domain-containing protein [Lujinxingia litoralis]RAL23495.1 hypothetical protein DL240_04860 [Lujinxingia litoralis]
MSHKLFQRTLLMLMVGGAALSLPAASSFAESPSFARPMARPWLGIILGSSDGTGVLVNEVLRTSPADDANLQPGDRVVAVDGEPVRTAGKLQALIRGKRLNQSVDLSVQRGEATLTRTLTLRASPEPDEVARRHLVGAPAPTFALSSVDGESMTPDALKGTAYIVDFWATWCQACKLGEPRIAALNERFGDRLQVITVSDEEAEVVRAFFADGPSRHAPVYLDHERTLTEAYLVRALPTYALVSAEGQVVELAFGNDQLDRLQAAIERILPEAPSPSPAD